MSESISISTIKKTEKTPEKIIENTSALKIIEPVEKEKVIEKEIIKNVDIQKEAPSPTLVTPDKTPGHGFPSAGNTADEKNKAITPIGDTAFTAGFDAFDFEENQNDFETVNRNVGEGIISSTNNIDMKEVSVMIFFKEYVLHYIILYYTILHYTILYYTILYYTTLYHTILYYTILYYTVLYYTILYCSILYYTIPYYVILYYSVLYYTIL